MMPKPVLRAIQDGIPLVVLSPHLDDAVLSCGAVMACAQGRTQVKVVTFFTEGGRPPYTRSARRFLRFSGAADADCLFAARRQEDVVVLRQLQAECAHVGLSDALFRRKPGVRPRWSSRLGALLPEWDCVYPTYRLHVSSGRIGRHDHATVQRVCESVQELARDSGALLLAPSAIGGHVDHVVVRTAAERSRASTVYYSDFPYNQNHQPDVGFLRRNHLVEATWSDRIDVKPELIRFYETQMGLLFPRQVIPIAPETYFVGQRDQLNTPC
jgi:LmbE family N-acetylglucosaminyl deacetylase